ncbi:hypothetical protein Vretimale_13387 [Volvox reticuliferus]|nr:hypothetical protein Vretifemale_14041 [Volvox reticuliferus]GIM09514.1 hypothetical protein Vretimale_13387 [Volvox reticuliferus]
MLALGAGDEAMPVRNNPVLGSGEDADEHNVGDDAVLPQGAIALASGCGGGGGTSTSPRPRLQPVPHTRRPPPWLAGRGLPRTSQARDTGASPACAQGLVAQAQSAYTAAAEVQRAGHLHTEPEQMPSPPRASGHTRSMSVKNVEAAPSARTLESGIDMLSADSRQSSSRGGLVSILVAGVWPARRDADIRASVTDTIFATQPDFPIVKVDNSEPLVVGVDCAAVATVSKPQGVSGAATFGAEAMILSPGHQEQHSLVDAEDSRPRCPLPVEESLSDEDESFCDPIGMLKDVAGTPDTLLGGQHTEQIGAVSATGTQSTSFASPRTQQWDASDGAKDGPAAGEDSTEHAEEEEGPQEDLENGRPVSLEAKFGSQGIQTSQYLLDSWLESLLQQRQCEPCKKTTAVQTSQAVAVTSALQPSALQLPPRLPPTMQPRQSQQAHGSLEPIAAIHVALTESPPIIANQASRNGQAAQVNQIETAIGTVARTASRAGPQLATLEARGERQSATKRDGDNSSAADHVSAVGSVTVTIHEQPAVKGLDSNGDSFANAAAHGAEAELPATAMPVQNNATAIAATTVGGIGEPSVSALRYGRLVRRGIPLENVQAWLSPSCAPLVAPSLVQDSLDVRNVAVGITCWPDVTMAVLGQLHSTTARPSALLPPRKAAGLPSHHEGLWRDNWLPTQVPRSVHDPGTLSMVRNTPPGCPPSTVERAAASAAAVATLEAAMRVVAEHRASIIAAMTVNRGAREGVSAAGSGGEQDRDDLTAAAPVHGSHGMACQSGENPFALGDAQQATGCPAGDEAVEPATTSKYDVLGHEGKQQQEQQEEVVAEPTPLFQDFEFASQSGPPMFFTQPLTQLF